MKSTLNRNKIYNWSKTKIINRLLISVIRWSWRNGLYEYDMLRQMLFESMDPNVIRKWSASMRGWKSLMMSVIVCLCFSFYAWLWTIAECMWKL